MHNGNNAFVAFYAKWKRKTIFLIHGKLLVCDFPVCCLLFISCWFFFAIFRFLKFLCHKLFIYLKKKLCKSDLKIYSQHKIHCKKLSFSVFLQFEEIFLNDIPHRFFPCFTFSFLFFFVAIMLDVFLESKKMQCKRKNPFT